MKTRIASLILLFFALVSVLSCSKQAVVVGGIEKANLIFNISVTGGTKASSTIEDTDSESSISSLRIFRIDADSEGNMKEPFSCTEMTGFTYDDESGTAYQTLKHSMSGDYLFFVIANWPSSLTLDTSSYEAMIGCYNAAAATSDVWAEGNFLMSQNGGPVFTHLSNLACDEDNPIVIDVELERVAAKVSVNLSSSASYPFIGTLMGGHDAVYAISKVEVKEFALINCVNQFNLLKSVDGSGKLVTPSSSTDYSISTGYYNTSLDVEDLDWKPMGTVSYCLENNSPLYSDIADDPNPDAVTGTKMKSRTTGVIFKVEMKSLSKFQSEADTDIENENLRVDPDEGLWKSSLNGEGSNDEEARTLYRYKGVLFADWQQLFAQNPSIASQYSQGETPTVSSLREKGITVFEDGLMYFVYWFKDGDVLSVTRNKYYNLLLEQVVTFGNDVPGGRNYNASDPVDLDLDALVSVSLGISDWIDTPAQDITL